MKRKGSKRILKIFLVVAILFALTIIIIPLLAFSVITKNTTLDNNKLKNKNQALKISANNGTIIKNLNSSIKIDELNDYTINAFIAKEDKRFYEHSGFDTIRIFGALKNNILAGEVVEGGSTITQQLVKNTHTNSERTLTRKIKEIKLATELEKKYSKSEVMEMYLNNIYFGNNCYGIADASLTYFGKSASDLSLAESAILAGLISAPSIYNPIANKSISIDKGKLVLSLMFEQSLISENELTSAMQEIEKIKICAINSTSSMYLEYAINEAKEILGVDELNQLQDIYIETYLDADIQTNLENEIRSGKFAFPNKNGISPEIGSVILDNKTGGIIAIAGVGEYNISSLRRQPASTIKPILVYAPAIEYLGYLPASKILDEPVNFSGYAPQNATKLNYGYTTIRDNIVRSTNIPAVKLLNEVGVERAKQFAVGFGIVFNEEDNNLALALGGFTDGVTITELAGAYCTFANYGVYSKPTYIKKITIDGNTVYSHTPSFTRACTEETAYLITDMLKSVAQYGTGRKIKSVGNFIASKTGTNSTTDNNLDAWNVSYTTQNTMVVWIGNTSGMNGSMHQSINGSTYATLLTKAIFEKMYADAKPQDFEKPNTIVSLQIDKDLFDSENKIYLADENSIHKSTELFKITNVPQTFHSEEEQRFKESLSENRLFSIKIM